MMIVLKYQSLVNIVLVVFLFVSANAGMIQNQKLFSGEWDWNSSLVPLYDSKSCPFIDSEFDCLKYGRFDKQYLQYTWKPTSSNLPRFNGSDLLRRWSRKKIMFVGDSLILNQWNSLVCLLHAANPKGRTSFVNGNRNKSKGSISYVTFKDYKLSVYLYTSDYLVDLVKEAKKGLVLKLDSIKQGNAWRGMDVLIFNTWNSWFKTGSWDLIQYGSTITKDMDRLAAFERGLTTWATWVDQNVNTSKTKVFFQGISPSHYEGKEWGSSSGCAGEIRPIYGAKYPKGRPKEANIVDKVLSKIRKPVYLLDITTLSQLRKDAHPSTYKRDRSRYDCTLWCIPGLPDTWNQLLYASVLG